MLESSLENREIGENVVGTLTSPNKINEVLHALQSKGVQITNCTQCHQNRWRADVLSYLVSPIPIAGQYNYNVAVNAPSQVPTLALTCNVCGHTLLFNLITLGVDI